MKTQEMPRGLLLQMHEQIQAFNQAEHFLHQNRIGEFYKKNMGRIQSSTEGKNKIIKDHYQINPQGVVVTRQKLVGDEYQFDERNQPIIEGVLLEGKTHEEYNKLMEAYMMEKVPVEKP